MPSKKVTSKKSKPEGALANSRAKAVEQANKGRKPLEAFMPKPGLRKRPKK